MHRTVKKTKTASLYSIDFKDFKDCVCKNNNNSNKNKFKSEEKNYK